MGGRVSNAWMAMAEAVAAAALGGACAFVAGQLLLANGFAGGAAAVSALTFVAVALFTYAALARLAAASGHPLTAFELEPVPAVEEIDGAPSELVLTADDRLIYEHAEASERAHGGELLLDDILAEIAPDARVVRLFDVNAMPTPGELQATIERHLNATGSASAPPDASDALHQALADLRRSLR